MFRESQKIQQSIDDRMLYINKQTRKAIDNSRAKLVGDVIYPNVNEKKFAALYSEIGSRPNIEIRRYVAALVLKRMYRMSDEVLLEFARCGALNFQYALHTTQEEEQPLSESSLRRFRRKIEAYNEENHCDLIKDEFVRISKQMAIKMGVLHKDPNEGEDESKPILVRMDSMEIEAHAKAMSRIEILYMTNVIVLRYLLKKDFGKIIPEELSHYLDDEDHNKVIYYRAEEDKKAGIQDTRVAEIVKEMILLQSVMKKYFTEDLLAEIPEYQIFQRVLEEQTQINEEGKRVPKEKSEISADSVQNPFDATMTYRYKRGQHHGHVLNTAEAVDDKGNGIIIYASLEPNTTSDSSMAEEYVEQLSDNEPEQIFTVDGAYNSEHLNELAKEKNVKIQTTCLTGKATNDVYADFVLNKEETEVLNCPKGYAPTSCKYNSNQGIITAKMPNNCCENCPLRQQCKAKINEKKHTSTVYVTGKKVARAKHARFFSTEEGKKNANRRNGVEGIMSVMRRKYDVDHIPVFGINRLKTWIWTTLLSYNLVKFQKYQVNLAKEAAAI